MLDTCTLDPDDLAIIRALQIDPRTPFTTMAAVLGLSEPTVSRRYGRLRRTGVLRVAAIVDPGALGQSQWTVRLRCRPGSVTVIAGALARRDDTSWIALGAAGAEITCAVRPRSPEQREDLLGDKLPRAAAVLDLDASLMLRQFLGGRGHYWAALDGALTPEQETRLGSVGAPYTEAPVFANPSQHLSAEDEELVAVLTRDGRASLAELAAAAGLTPGRASRRLRALVADRVVHIDVELAPGPLGYHARANLWLRVHPSHVRTVGRTLAQMPEVGYVAAMSGSHNVNAVIHCVDVNELFEFTTDRIGALPGVESAETSPIQRQIKQAATLVTDDRLDRH